MGNSTHQALTIVGKQQLAEYPFPRALADLAQEKASGTLRVRRGKLERSILLESGAPVYVESSIAEESLERFLVRRGELEKTNAFQAASEAVASDRPVVEVLLQKGVLGPNEMFKRLKLCMGANILATFRWGDGELLYDGSPPPTEGKTLLKISPGPLVVRGVCAYSPFEQINKEFLKFKCDRFRLLGTPAEAIARLQLDPIQSRIANALTEAASPNEVAAQADADMELVLRALYALVVLGVAVPAVEAENAAAPPRSDAAAEQPAKTEPAEQGPVSAPPEPLTPEEQGRIERALGVARQGTYYELLGVAPTVRFVPLRQSFFAKCYELSPMSFVGRDLGRHQEQLEELFLALVRAFSTLSTTAARQAYDAKLKREAPHENEGARRREKPPAEATVRAGHPRGEKAPAAATVREGQQRRRSPAPERSNAFWVEEPAQASAAVKTAVAFLNMSQPAEAVATLMEARRADPEDALALALLGYSLYLTDPHCKGPEATKYLRRAIKRDERATLPRILLGRVLELEQIPAEALACYQACLALEPGHAEAVNAVSRLRGRS